MYYLFEVKIKSNNRDVVNNFLIYENGIYRMDYDDLEEKVKCSNNKVLIFCSFYNFVGRVWREDELKKVVEICKKYDLWIIVDEIYFDLIRKGFKYIFL